MGRRKIANECIEERHAEAGFLNTRILPLLVLSCDCGIFSARMDDSRHFCAPQAVRSVPNKGSCMSRIFLTISGLGAKADWCSYRLIAYLPKFASICALPGRIATLQSLEGMIGAHLREVTSDPSGWQWRRPA